MPENTIEGFEELEGNEIEGPGGSGGGGGGGNEPPPESGSNGGNEPPPESGSNGGNEPPPVPEAPIEPSVELIVPYTIPEGWSVLLNTDESYEIFVTDIEGNVQEFASGSVAYEYNIGVPTDDSEVRAFTIYNLTRDNRIAFGMILPDFLRVKPNPTFGSNIVDDNGVILLAIPSRSAISFSLEVDEEASNILALQQSSATRLDFFTVTQPVKVLVKILDIVGPVLVKPIDSDIFFFE